MNESIFILIIVIFLFLIIISSDKDKTTDLEDDITANYYFPKEKDNKLYHPTTGYSCDTQEQMNTYICNRERKLKEER